MERCTSRRLASDGDAMRFYETCCGGSACCGSAFRGETCLGGLKGRKEGRREWSLFLQFLTRITPSLHPADLSIYPLNLIPSLHHLHWYYHPEHLFSATTCHTQSREGRRMHNIDSSHLLSPAISLSTYKATTTTTPIHLLDHRHQHEKSVPKDRKHMEGGPLEEGQSIHVHYALIRPSRVLRLHYVTDNRSIKDSRNAV